MQRHVLFIGLILVVIGLATPSNAGMDADLSDCKTSEDLASARACTRILDSGRLPREQIYIAHFNRGWAYRNAGDYDKALADFDRVAELNPRYADTYYSRAVVEYDRGNHAKSVSDLDLYLERKGGYWMAYHKRALMFRRLGEWDRALADSQKAIALNPSDQKPLLLRALVLSDRGEQTEARAEIEKVMAAKPGLAGVFYARALVAFRQNQLDTATTDAEKAVSLDNDFPAVHALLGRISETRGNGAVATAHYQHALKAPATSIEARYAQDEARERIKALNGPAAPAHVAASSFSECRRYIAAVGATIATDCAD